MKIAVIDDGINFDYFPNIGKLAFDLKVNKRDKIVKRIGYDKTTPSHGTTCAAIIKKHAPNAEIGSVKVISDTTMRGYAKHLIAALNWCLDNKIKLIHMSIGSCNVRDRFSILEAVQALEDNGCIIVAALSNNMKYTVPACSESVLGVRTSAILKNEQFICDDGGIFSTPFVASSIHELQDLNGNSTITPICNSYAAPLITAKVHHLLENNNTLSLLKIRKMLGFMDGIRNYDQLLKRTPLLSEVVEIPIICVRGCPKSAQKAAAELNEIFLERGYSCMAFTDDIHEISSKITRIPADIQANKLFSFYVNCLELDLIIFACNNFVGSDGSLTLLKSITNSKYCGDNVTIPENFTAYQIKSVMKYFIKRGS